MTKKMQEYCEGSQYQNKRSRGLTDLAGAGEGDEHAGLLGVHRKYPPTIVPAHTPGQGMNVEVMVRL